MQKITPFVWFDTQAEEAANFYVSAFKHSKLGVVTRYNDESAKVSGQPKGSVMTVAFKIEGYDLVAINGGSFFTLTPAISLSVTLESAEEIDALWAKLIEGGKALMPLQEYPFSKKYGWVQDKFGLSWQIVIGKREQKIMPSMMFVGDKAGKADEAMNFYMSLFPKSQSLEVHRYGPGQLDPEDSITFGRFTLHGQEFAAMDSAGPHTFTFTPALSFIVNCDTQGEIDTYWNALSAVKEAEQCGWLQDKYGVSWQINPSMMGTWMADPKKAGRVMDKVLKMKKLDITVLQKAAQDGPALSLGL